MNFTQYCSKHKFTSQPKQREALIGKKVRITGNSNNHNWGSPGTVHVVTANTHQISFNGNNLTGLCPSVQAYMCNSWLPFADFEVIDNTLESIKSQITANKEEIARLKAESELLNKKRDYLEYHKLEELDDRQFLAYEIVQVMKSDENDKVKAKAIAELLP